MADLVGSGGTVALTGETGRPPAGWRLVLDIPGVQMVCERPGSTSTAGSSGRPPEDVPVPLGEGDVRDMLALVAEAQPGPFLPGTIEFGATSASGERAAWWPWPASACSLPGTSRSARWPPIPPTAAKAWPSSWSGP